MPQGYRLAELGPDSMKMKGQEYMEQDRKRLRQNVLLRCSIAARSHTSPPKEGPLLYVSHSTLMEQEIYIAIILC